MSREIDELIEQVAGADRPVASDELRYHPAWHDLDATGRQRAYELARAADLGRPAVIRTQPCGSTRSTRAAATRARHR